MTTLIAPSKLTPEDLLRLPDNTSLELVDGEAVEKNVSVLSSETEGTFLTALSAFAMKLGNVRAFPATLGYRCFADEPDRIRKPDVTLVRLERLKALADQNPGYMPIVPDLAVEVVSTNDTLTEIDAKVEEYRIAGFPLVWIADPVARVIYVYPTPGKPQMLIAADDIRCEAVLPGFVCKVGELFPSSF